MRVKKVEMDMNGTSTAYLLKIDISDIAGQRQAFQKFLDGATHSADVCVTYGEEKKEFTLKEFGELLGFKVEEYPMNKAAWDALDGDEKTYLILKVIFRWPDEILKSAILADYAYPPLRYTTDRNACALVLDEIRKRGTTWDTFCWVLLIYLYDGTTGCPAVEYGDRGFRDLCVVDAGGFMDKLLRADPDMICYCAIKAVEDDS